MNRDILSCSNVANRDDFFRWGRPEHLRLQGLSAAMCANILKTNEKETNKIQYGYVLKWVTTIYISDVNYQTEFAFSSFSSLLYFLIVMSSLSDPSLDSL